VSWRGILAWSTVGIALVVVFWLETFTTDAGRVWFVELSMFLRRSPRKAALGLRLASNDGRRTGRGRLLARELLAKPLSLGWMGLGFL
jgi:hypothetical protein